MRPRVAIYRERLLPASETFIPAQADALGGWEPVYIGAVADASGSALLGDRRREMLASYTGAPNAWRAAQRTAGIIQPRWLAAIRDLAPELVHAHFGPDGVWAMPLARRLGVPLIVTFHGWDFAICRGRMTADGGALYPLYARRRPRLFEVADRVVAVSRYAAEQLARLGCPEHKIAIHPIGVDVNRFDVQQGEREPVILFVGRLVAQKGTAYLLDAFERLQALHPGWRVVVVGDGPERARLEASARERELAVGFQGALPPQEVAAWLARASIFCVPSLVRVCGCGEAFGIAFAEAQAAGVPVVSFDEGGVGEAVENGSGGLLVPHRDLDALTDALGALMQDAGLRTAMGTAARARIERRYRLADRTAELEGTYAAVTGGRSSLNDLTRT